MPPRIMTMVMPQARNRLDDICLSTLNIFFWVRKEPLVFGNTDKKNTQNKQGPDDADIILEILFYIFLQSGCHLTFPFSYFAASFMICSWVTHSSWLKHPVIRPSHMT